MSLNKKYLFFPAISALILGISRMPWGMGFISYCSFVPLLYFFDLSPDKKHLNSAAALFSLIFTVTALHWITLVTPAGFAGMIILFALYFAIMFHLISISFKYNHKWKYLFFILIWLSFEHLQNFGQFAFPWFYTAYSLGDYTPLIQPAELGGISLVSLYIVSTNILIYCFFRFKKAKYLIFLITIHLIWTGFSVYRYISIDVKNTGKKAGIVQVSIPQNLKWLPAYRDTTLDLYYNYTGKLSADTRLVIFPESAIPGYVLHRYKFRKFIDKVIEDHNKSVFTGFPDFKFDDNSEDALYYNACSYFDSTSSRYPVYYKQILVPFGERIPLLNIMPVLNRIELGQANWEYGDKLHYYNYDGLKFTPQICFEVAFPWINVDMASQNPDFIVNLTNDAWFHFSAGTYQHALMTRFRAIETRTQYFRAANTGYSMIIDPKGDILAKTELFTKEAIEAYIFNYLPQSLYVRYFKFFPDLITALCVFMILWSLMKKILTQ